LLHDNGHTFCKCKFTFQKGVHMSKNGFTLIELLVVISIIITLMAIMLPNIFAKGDDMKRMATETMFETLKQPLREFAARQPKGKYPEASSEQEGNGTSNLVLKLSEGNYFQFSDDSITREKPYQLVDAWGFPMRYQPWFGCKVKADAHNKAMYDLWSAGADNDFENPDDNVKNWSVLLESD